MKKIICLVLSLMLLLSMAACGQTTEENQNTTITTEPAEETVPETTEEVVQTPAEYVTTFYMDLKATAEDETAYLVANLDENGGASLEYNTSAGRKIGSVDKVALEQIAAAYRLSEMSQLSGDTWDEGEAYGSFTMVIGEENFSYAYNGEFVPAEFTTAFADMEALFIQLMTAIPEYVPTAQVMEGVNQEHLAAINEILNTSGYTALDTLSVMDIPKDENFGYMAGLSTSDGLTVATSVTHMMMTTPFSLVVVTTTEGTDSKTVIEDFQKSLDWGKWVCVNPSNAVIATRDNMVLCLIGLDELYTGCASAVEASGWTIEQELKNPNL